MNIYGTFVPGKFDKEELQRRIDKAHRRYDQYQMLETYDFLDFLKQFRKLESEGFTLDTAFLPMISPLASTCQLLARFVKPAKVIKAELSELDKTTAAEYQTFLEGEKQRAIEAMAQRLIAEQLQKEVKAQEQELAEKISAARIEAAEILGVAGV